MESQRLESTTNIGLKSGQETREEKEVEQVRRRRPKPGKMDLKVE